MNIQGTRFGTVDYSEEDIVRFPEGLIGFSKLQHFVLLSMKEGSPFRWLQSLEEPALAFLLTDPNEFVQDYEPEVQEHLLKAIDITEQTPRILLTTATIPKGKPEDMTLNLAAPIVINAASRNAKQLVLEEHAYTIKHRVFPAADPSGEKQAA